MAITILTGRTQAVAINYSYTTSGSTDWTSIPNSTYFYDLVDKLPHYKNSSGTVIEVFSDFTGGLTYFIETGNTVSPNNTVPVVALIANSGVTDVDVAIVPKGTGAFMLDIPDNTATGGNKRGANAVDLQIDRSSSSQVASGANSFAVGYGNTASGSQSIAMGLTSSASGLRNISIGDSNTASNNWSTAIGRGNTANNDTTQSFGALNSSTGYWSFTAGLSNIASNTYAVSVGISNTASGAYSTGLGVDNTANGEASTSFGYRSHVFGVYGRQSYASGRESTNGDAQTSKFILRERTTGNTATTLTTNSNAASTNNQVILSNQSAYRFKGTIIGKQSGSTNAAVWDIDGFIVRGANAAATTLNVSNVTLVQNTPAWGTPTLAADTTNGGLQVQVTGAAATNIQWVANIETTEVIYA